MKEIKQTFTLNFGGDDNGIRVVAQNNGKHYISVIGRSLAYLTTQDIKDLGIYLLEIACQITNDPDFNESKSQESS